MTDSGGIDAGLAAIISSAISGIFTLAVAIIAARPHHDDHHEDHHDGDHHESDQD